MAVVVNEFEVVPQPTPAAPEPRQAAPEQQRPSVSDELDRALRALRDRALRLRAD